MGQPEAVVLDRGQRTVVDVDPRAAEQRGDVDVRGAATAVGPCPVGKAGVQQPQHAIGQPGRRNPQDLPVGRGDAGHARRGHRRGVVGRCRGQSRAHGVIDQQQGVFTERLAIARLDVDGRYGNAQAVRAVHQKSGGSRKVGIRPVRAVEIRKVARRGRHGAIGHRAFRRVIAEQRKRHGHQRVLPAIDAQARPG
ncbi:hypothetical protein D3C73_695730 [compost metagenome]